MGKDDVTFRDYDKYIKFLRESTTANDPEYIANHEREHFQKAIDLGYTPVYGARMSESDLLYGFIDFVDRKPTQEHLIEILLAPEIPSKDDLNLAERLKKELSIA